MKGQQQKTERRDVKHAEDKELKENEYQMKVKLKVSVLTDLLFHVKDFDVL
jgi:hypothetical protein